MDDYSTAISNAEDAWYLEVTRPGALFSNDPNEESPTFEEWLWDNWKIAVVRMVSRREDSRWVQKIELTVDHYEDEELLTMFKLTYG